jgi:hypothetical protein
MDTLIVENETVPRPTLSWPGVLAGAAIATALSMALLALGAGLGFSVVDPWAANGALPETTKAATVAGIYMTVTAVMASAVGGYVAGRLRALWPGVHEHEAFFRDTVHGVAAWAVSVLATAAFLGSVGALIAGGAASGAAQRERSTVFAPLVDRLFVGGGDERTRAFADRILGHLRSGHALTDQDRQSLVAVVAARNNQPPAEAEQRVMAVEVDARAAADTARRVAARLSFWFVAAMLAGALAGGLAGWEGGAVRDGRMRYGRA